MIKGNILSCNDFIALMKLVKPFYDVPDIDTEITKANTLYQLEMDIYYWLSKAPYNCISQVKSEPIVN